MNPEPPGFYGDKLDLSTVSFTPALLRTIPATFALEHCVLPISQSESGALAVATADPSDIDTLDSLTHLLHRDIELRPADQLQLGIYLQRFYGAGKAHS